MRVNYTSKLPDQFGLSESCVLQNTGEIYPINHGSTNNFLIGLIQRRPDGFYFVPGADIQSSLIGKCLREEPSRGIKKLRPNIEELEIFGHDNFPIGTVAVSKDKSIQDDTLSLDKN
ncbi:hypothetical protein HYX07_00460 [Candidatus Woesearchaeota archaeon]|nr:hypothetical protein [Candidatus Woesearchaeota archaeon]